MIKIKKTISQKDLANNQEVISNIKGHEVVQVITQDSDGSHSLKIVMTQEQFVELMNDKSVAAIPKEIMDKVKIFEIILKRVAKVLEALQDDGSKKK